MRALTQRDIGTDENDIAPLPFDHSRQYRGRQPVGPDQMNLNLRLEVLGAGLVQPAELGLTRAGHQHLDVAEFLTGPVHERRHGLGVGDIEWQRHGFTAVGADLGGEFLALLHPPRAQGDRETPGGKFKGSRGPDSRRCAGDQGGPAGRVRVETGHQTFLTVIGRCAKPRTLLE